MRRSHFISAADAEIDLKEGKRSQSRENDFSGENLVLGKCECKQRRIHISRIRTSKIKRKIKKHPVVVV
jgi:hypothetical protein